MPADVTLPCSMHVVDGDVQYARSRSVLSVIVNPVSVARLCIWRLRDGAANPDHSELAGVVSRFQFCNRDKKKMKEQKTLRSYGSTKI